MNDKLFCGKIGWGQLAVLLVLSRVFTEAMNFPYEAQQYGMQRFFVIILAKMAVLLLYIPLIIAVRAAPGKGIFGIVAEKSRALAVILAVPLSLYLLTAGAAVFGRIELFITDTLIPDASAAAIIILVLAAVTYGVSMGISACARTGFFIAVLFALLTVLMLLTLGSKIDLGFLYPAIIENGDSLPGEILSEVSKNNELALFAVLCGAVRGKAERAVYVYIPAALIITLMMNFLYNTVLGEYMNILCFPFYMLASLSDVVMFERLDGIDVAVWTLAAALKLCLTVISLRIVWDQCLGKRAGIIAKWAALPLTAVGGLMLSANKGLFVGISDLARTVIPLFVAGLIIPLIAMIFALIGRKRNEKSDMFDSLG